MGSSWDHVLIQLCPCRIWAGLLRKSAGQRLLIDSFAYRGQLCLCTANRKLIESSWGLRNNALMFPEEFYLWYPVTGLFSFSIDSHGIFVFFTVKHNYRGRLHRIGFFFFFGKSCLNKRSDDCTDMTCTLKTMWGVIQNLQRYILKIYFLMKNNESHWLGRQNLWNNH